MKTIDHSTVRNTQWQLWQDTAGSLPIEQANLAVLMDIRESLRDLLALLRCPRFIGIPARLEAIEKNTRRKRKRVAR